MKSPCGRTSTSYRCLIGVFDWHCDERNAEKSCSPSTWTTQARIASTSSGTWTRAGWVHVPLDVDAMRACVVHVLGEQDFSAFRSSQCQSKTPIKHLYEVDVRPQGDFIHFRFRANAFLHHMVRNLMGCLIEVGRRRR